jgi:eukaryotic-like serine/threonine-protein kinase
MPLVSGTKLGPYEIVSPLGAGGMGEVYRAKDTRLERTVAIKILPAEVAKDAVRKQRFEREAKTISSLNHPNICTLHDIGSQDGVEYLVMECVEGETLAKRLEKGPLPMEQVLKYGAQIADALDKAHRAGIVHRDLKPGNIMLTGTGAKLLDFGLAKPAAPLASVATLTAAVARDSPVTEQGTIVGTFQYMSPEQVEGKEVDGRSDIFSLGAVLYEMQTGKRAFEGKSQLSVASAILERDPPPISVIKPMTPPALDHTIRRCIAKGPEDRWQSAADLKCELAWIIESGSHSAAAPIPASRGAKALSLYAGLATVVALTVAGFLWRQSAKQPRNLSPVRFIISLPASDPISLTTGPALAFEPDTQRIVYVVRHEGATRLYLRDLNAFEGKLLADTEGAAEPFFSPNGQWIGFQAGGKLKKISVNGGPAIVICDAPEGNGATWLPDDTIVFNADWREGLRRVSAAGGTSQVVSRPDRGRGEAFHWWPEVLPSGEAVLFTDQKGPSSSEGNIAVLSLKTGESRIVLPRGSNAHYLPADKVLLYFNERALWAAPFDPVKLEVTGPSFPALQGFLSDQDSTAAQVALSRDGSIVFVPATFSQLQNTLMKVDRTGHEQPLTELRRDYEDLTLSPDGRFLAMTVRGDAWNVWLYDLERGTLSRVTFDGDNRDPIWTVDSKRVVYVSFRNGRFGLYWKPIYGNGAEEALVTTDGIPWPNSCSADGRSCAYDLGPGAPSPGIYLLPLVGERKTTALLADPSAQGAMISPDGKWVAYQSTESGRDEVYVRQFPSGASKWQLSAEGGVRPIWSANGRELFFREGGLRSESMLMSVAIQTQPSFTAGSPKQLFPFRYAQAGHDYAVTPDGQHFICIKEPQAGPTEVAVVLNWASELVKK